MTLIRILVVDNSPDFLDAATRFLASDPNMEIIGATLSGQEALRQVETHHPDLVLMDLALCGQNGLEITRRLKENAGAPKVILSTLHDDDEYRLASQAASADGYIAKSEFGTQLLPKIHSLFEAVLVPQN